MKMNEFVKIDPRLRAQIANVSKVIHGLLDGPNGDGQLTGKMETQRVTLEVPRAFVVLASFLATFDPKENGPSDFWSDECEEGALIDDPKVRLMMRRRLERVLYNAMHDELHWIATHWFLTEPESVPSDRVEVNLGGASFDGEVPF
jgi:hypothetical protein